MATAVLHRYVSRRARCCAGVSQARHVLAWRSTAANIITSRSHVTDEAATHREAAGWADFDEPARPLSTAAGLSAPGEASSSRRDALAAAILRHLRQQQLEQRRGERAASQAGQLQFTMEAVTLNRDFKVRASTGMPIPLPVRVPRCLSSNGSLRVALTRAGEVRRRVDDLRGHLTPKVV